MTKPPYVPTEYSVKPGLKKLGEDKHFIVDGMYPSYMAEKKIFDSTDQYYINNASDEVTETSFKWIKDTLQKEYEWEPFGHNFDFICLEIQEDVCVMQNDSLVIAHVCFPSWWGPEEKMGMSMGEMHADVPGMDKTKYEQIWNACLRKGPYLRYNWTLTNSPQLNQHPKYNIGKDFDGEDLFLRVERRVLVGLPEIDAVIFLIRTFVNNIDELNCCERAEVGKAVQGMNRQELEYKGLFNVKEKVIRRLTKDKESVILCMSG